MLLLSIFVLHAAHALIPHQPLPSFNASTFMTWLASHGSRFDAMGRVPAYRNAKEGRGCAAYKDIAKGDVVARIPMEILLTPRRAKAISPLASFFAERSLAGPLLNSHLITLALMDERLAEQCEGGDVRCARPLQFAPYWRMLPTLADYKRTLPVLFSDEDLAWVKGSPLIDKIRSHTASWEREWERILRMLPEFCALRQSLLSDTPARRPPGACRELSEGRAPYLRGVFLWARAVTTTRAFSITVNRDEKPASEAASQPTPPPANSSVLRDTNLVGNCAVQGESASPRCPFAGSTATAEQCAQTCLTNALCVAWTWHDTLQPEVHRGWAQHCYHVREDVPLEPEAASSHTSGIILYRPPSGSGGAGAAGGGGASSSSTLSTGPSPHRRPGAHAAQPDAQADRCAAAQHRGGVGAGAAAAPARL